MLVITTEPLQSKTHPTPISFFGDVRLLSTELEVVVKCIRAKTKSRLQLIVDAVHRGVDGVQHENVVKPLVVEKSTEVGKLEARVATPLAAASLEELLDQVEASTTASEATESVLNDLGIEWNFETKKDVAAQLLRGLAHLHEKFTEKADGSFRYFVNLKPSNVLLFSRGSHGGVNLKLSDFFCHSVRTKDELVAILAEKFDRVPEMKDSGDDLVMDQWSIIDAELSVAGLLLQRLFASDDVHLQQLVSSMTRFEPSGRLSAVAAANHPFFWSSAMKISFLTRFLAALDFRRKGLKDAVRNTRLLLEEESASSSSSWADERHGIDCRLLEELRKKRKGGYEVDNLLGLVEFMQDAGKQLARPTRVLAPLMEELFSSSSSSSPDALAEYFLVKFPRLPETLLPICAELPTMKEFVREELERFDIPATDFVSGETEEEEEEEEDVEEKEEEKKIVPSSFDVDSASQNFANFRQTSRRSHSDEEDQRRDSASPTNVDADDCVEGPSSISESAVVTSSHPASTTASQIDADIDALTSMWSEGAGDIVDAPRASGTTASDNVDDLSDLLAGFGVAEKEPQKQAPADHPQNSPLDLSSLSEALLETEKKKSVTEKVHKTSLAIILTAKEQLECGEVDEALGALKDVDMTYDLLLETKIGLALRAAKKQAQDDKTKKACSDLISKWKTLLLDQVGKENEEKRKLPSSKKKLGFQFLPETATTDELRIKSRKMILDALVERKEEAPSMKIAKNIAARVEETIFQSNKGDSGQKYRSAIRSRVFNLRDAKNPELGDDVVDGNIRPEAFALMTAEEMASKDMKRLREQLQQEANRTERVLHSPRNLFLTRW